tara:strand:+ start:2272 stop:2508 length:237 start_codon:yes stop_codon:yes gene_type:complete
MGLEMVTEQSIREMKKIFYSYDRNRNGELSKSELQRFFKSMNTYFSRRELDVAIHIIDTNNDGKVTFSEFIQFMLEDE